MKLLGAQAVRAALLSGAAVALVDVREQVPFARGHILLAVHAPLSRLEIALPPLVPSRAVRLILCDGGEGLAERAAVVAAGMGYRDIAVLEGGAPAWQAEGHRLFTGLNATGAALAETLDLVCGPPQMAPAELVCRRTAGEPVLVLDARPWEEYCDHHIPGALSCPGGELVYRITDLVPDSSTTVVVNCAGRSRSIFGAQSLIAAGLPNPVYALAQGTYGWQRAGFELARGPGPRSDRETGGGTDQARRAAARLAAACGVREITAAELNRWCRESDEETLYLLDVRSPEEYVAGHAPGARSAPGGQLVECADDWIGVRAGRIVLLDDDGVRAPMAAAWLRQLGYPNVAMLADPAKAADIVGPADATPPNPPQVHALEAKDMTADDVLLDLSAGPSFVRCHGAGAFWALRSRLPEVLERLSAGRLLVMDDVDSEVAARAVAELHGLGRNDACLLRGGLDALRQARASLTQGREGMLHPMDDTVFLPADMREDPMAEAGAYLAWQATLAQEIAEDGLLAFAPYCPRATIPETKEDEP